MAIFSPITLPADTVFMRELITLERYNEFKFTNAIDNVRFVALYSQESYANLLQFGSLTANIQSTVLGD
jgi:hypothetical protein